MNNKKEELKEDLNMTSEIRFVKPSLRDEEQKEI